MTTVHAELLGDKLLVSRHELEQLVELAKRTAPVQLQILPYEISTDDLMQLSEKGGSFGFWEEKGEDIYSANDGEPV